MSYEEFKTEYVKTFNTMMKYSPKQAGSEIYAAKMADLYDMHPEWADAIEEEVEA
jgi:hypothetical protein